MFKFTSAIALTIALTAPTAQAADAADVLAGIIVGAIVVDAIKDSKTTTNNHVYYYNEPNYYEPKVTMAEIYHSHDSYYTNHDPNRVCYRETVRVGDYIVNRLLNCQGRILSEHTRYSR